MGLTGEEQKIVQVFTIGACFFGIVGSMYILLSYAWMWRDAKMKRRCRYKDQCDSFTNQLIVVLAIFDLGQVGSKILSLYAYDLDNLHGAACQLQAGLLNFSILASVSWNCCMAFNLCRWTVYRECEVQLKSRFKMYVALSVVPGCILTIVEWQLGQFGDAKYWCWLKNDMWRLFGFYVWMMASVLFIFVSLLVVRKNVRSRMISRQDLEAKQETDAVLRKLTYYVSTYIVLWIFPTIDRAVTWWDRPYFVLAILHTTCISLQGFANAIIFGGLLEWIKGAFLCKQNRLQKDIAMEDKAHQCIDILPETKQDVDTSKISIQRSIFATTFNMGESSVPENLEAWIPNGKDVYVIGVQECMCLQKLRAKLLQHLHRVHSGVAFTQFGREIGRTTKKLGYHGYIAITIYAKTSEVESGMFYLPACAKTGVFRGKSLGLTRASNKGAVGFSFQYHHRSFAVANCHLASDSNGKTKIWKRNVDAVGMLQDLQLDPDHTGFEFPLMHHHSIVLGDLNYRMTNFNRTAQEVQRKVTSVLQLENGDHHPAEREDAWQELLCNDELNSFMDDNLIFAGFNESVIRFPPTYRRCRKSKLNVRNSTQVSDLDSFYCTSVCGQGKRIPSYTDRILYSSLDNLTDKITCHDYVSCEELTESDHRPVSCVFDVELDAPRSFSDSSALAATMKDIDGVQEAILHIKNVSSEFWCPRIRRRSTGTFDVDQHKSQKGAFSTHTCEIANGEDLSSCFDCDTLYSDFSEHRQSISTVGDPHFVEVVFPLPSEDPFSEQRKIHELASAFKAGVNLAPLSKAKSSKSIHHIIPWSQFEAEGLQRKVVTKGSDELHAAFKLCSKKSINDVGQAVISLPKVEGKFIPFRTMLTIGGQQCGWLQGSVAVTKQKCTM